MRVEQKVGQAPITRRNFLRSARDLSLATLLISKGLYHPDSISAQTLPRQLEVEGPIYDVSEIGYLLPYYYFPDRPLEDLAKLVPIRRIEPSTTQLTDHQRSLAIVNREFLNNLSMPPITTGNGISVYLGETDIWESWQVPNTNIDIIYHGMLRPGFGMLGVFHAYRTEASNTSLAQSLLYVSLGEHREGQITPQALRFDLNSLLIVPPEVTFQPVAVSGISGGIDFQSGKRTSRTFTTQGLKGNGRLADGREIDILTTGYISVQALALITEAGLPKRLFY